MHCRGESDTYYGLILYWIRVLGTKVRSLVDGVVVAVDELYSHDVTVHVASDPTSL